MSDASTWPRVVTLKHAIEFGSEQIGSLTFRRGKLGDLKGMKLSDNVPVEQLMAIASRMCGQPTAVLDRLDVDDAGEVVNIALDFFVACLGASKRPSQL